MITKLILTMVILIRIMDTDDPNHDHHGDPNHDPRYGDPHQNHGCG